MTAAKIFVAIVFAASAFAEPSNPCDPRHNPIAGCKPIVQQMVDDVVDFRAKIAEESALIAQARTRFFATYPDKPGAAEAKAEFSKALHEKDCYYLWIYLNDRDPHVGTVMADPTLAKRVFDTLGGKLDGGIRQTAFPEFYDWAMEVRRNVGTIDITNALNVPTRLLKALPASEAKHEIYLQQRDWAEFDAAGREPVGLDDPALYFPALCVRFQEIPWSDAIKEYNGMVKALGEDVVKRAVQQVRAAPRDSGGRLLAVNTRDPVKRGPGGALVEDYTVPQPEGVIGVWASPIKAVEQLAIQGDDRRYLLWLLTERMGDFRLDKTHFHAVKWPFAETTYHRYVIAFGEPTVLEASRKVRTAVKRMTDGSVMDPKAIGGSTRNSPYYVFEDLVTRKDPRGYVRSLLAFNAKLTSTAEVDAAYQKFFAASNESAVLEAARKMAAGTPYPTSEADLKTLTSVLKGPLSLEKPAVTLVDDPDYLAWKGFSPGAKASYVTRPLRPVRAGSKDLIPGKMDGRHTYLLRSIKDEQALLWRTSTVYDPDGSAHPPRDLEVGYPAKMPQPRAVDINSVETGQETLEVGGKRVGTRWLAVTSSGGKCYTKTWTSDEVPGGVVRKEDNGCYDLGWLTGMFLESFEGARQPGVTTPFILPSVSAPSSTSATSPASTVPRAKGSATGVPPRPTAPAVHANAPAPPAASATNITPAQPQPTLDPSMPNYDLTNKMASGLILQYCRGMYDPVDPFLTPDQSRIKTANRTAIEAEVQKCVSAFDMTEMTAHRRIAMRYCFVNNDYTVAGQASRMKTYDQCMNQNDVLTAFCTQELKYRSELSRTPNVADQRCPAPRPNFREGLVIRNGGHDDFGHPVVVASTGPGLPPILLAPMEPGMIQRGGGASPSVSTANPVTAPTPSQPVQPASDRAASAQPVAPVPPVAAAAPQMRDLNLRYAALLRRAVRAKAGVAQIEQRLAGQGFGLRTDVRDARSRLDSQLQAAMESISRGDADHAEESLRYAEGALGTIEKFLGR